jgi:hypothetical protein
MQLLLPIIHSLKIHTHDQQAKQLGAKEAVDTGGRASVAVTRRLPIRLAGEHRTCALLRTSS